VVALAATACGSDERGHDVRVIDWLDEITADCPKKHTHDWNDQCAARCPDLPKVL
jgi:hypothetical protein